MNNYQFEVCANSVESCLAAQKGGATRVELCAAIPEGGTTPSYGEIKVARKMLTTTKLHVIIRPRGGDFLYSEVEQLAMIEDIRMCKELGVDGVVIGCLLPDGSIDVELTKRLVVEAEDMSVTFHRAFDMCKDPIKGLEDIISTGCNRILTSGQENTAYDGIDLLRKLNELAGDRITILAGCGVKETNIKEISERTGIKEFHFSAREEIASGMTFKNNKVSMGGVVKIEEYSRSVTTAKRVEDTILAIKR